MDSHGRSMAARVSHIIHRLTTKAPEGPPCTGHQLSYSRAKRPHARMITGIYRNIYEYHLGSCLVRIITKYRKISLVAWKWPYFGEPWRPNQCWRISQLPSPRTSEHTANAWVTFLPLGFKMWKKIWLPSRIPRITWPNPSGHFQLAPVDINIQLLSCSSCSILGDKKIIRVEVPHGSPFRRLWALDEVLPRNGRVLFSAPHLGSWQDPVLLGRYPPQAFAKDGFGGYTSYT